MKKLIQIGLQTFAETISRANAEALIPEEVTKEIMQGAIAASATLSMFKKLPNMSSNRLSMPVLDLLPISYWVTGDTGQKKTTKQAWEKKMIYAEEVAVIVPIAEAVLADAEDSGYDIWGEIMPRINEAFGTTIDNAVLFDVNKPTSWREGIVNSAIRAGNVVNAASTPDVYAEIFGESGVIAEVENDGYMPNGIISAIQMRGKLRGLRDENKNPLFSTSLKEAAAPYALDGMPMFFLVNGAWDNDKCHMITGDMSQAVFSIRQDITYKLLTEGIIQDTNGDILYNLAQQDMVALRIVMRIGWEIPNPVNALNDNSEIRFPFAVYNPNGAAVPTIGALTVTSVAGTASGDTLVTATPTHTDGILYFKTGASVDLPAINDPITGYTLWNGTDDITATTGHDIVIAEYIGDGFKYAGKATVVSKA